MSEKTSDWTSSNTFINVKYAYKQSSLHFIDNSYEFCFGFTVLFNNVPNSFKFFCLSFKK